MPDLVGRKLGKYELVERLGQGGMAEVYKAFQPGVERHVAIKVMHTHLADSEDFVQRFQREARSIGQLQHSHILRVIDFDVESDVYYMVMDYIQGGDLDGYLKSKGALPADEALHIVGQLADALKYAHQQGMIHRDIKPANVMFMDDNQSHTLLADFGIARLMGEAGGGLTMTGAMVGTPNYMSPEAVRGEECDERSDLYSLGVVLYELVTGKTPYDADTPYSFIMKQANEPLRSPRELNPDVPEPVEQLLLKALAHRSEERFQNAAEFANAVHQAQTALDGSSTSSSTSKTIRRSTAKSPTKGGAKMENTRRWLPVALAGIGVLFIAIITVVALTQFGGEETPTGSIVEEDTPTAVSQAEAEPPATDTPAPTEAPTEAEETEDAEDRTEESDTTASVTTEITNTTAITTEEASAVATTTDASSVPITATSELSSTATITETEPLTDTVAAESVDSILTQSFIRRMGMLRIQSQSARINSGGSYSEGGYSDDSYSDGDTSESGAQGLLANSFALQLNYVPLPPADSHYQLWLANEDDNRLNLGQLEIANGRIHLVGDTEQNLLEAYNRVLISVEPDEDADPEISDEIVLESVLPTEFLTPIRQMVVADELTGKGFLLGAQEQLEVALSHTGFSLESLDQDNLNEARQHAEHVINVLEGKEGRHYGDLDGDGLAQNPGDGFGVRTYLENAHIQTQLALDAAALFPEGFNTPELQFYGEREVNAQRNSLALLEIAAERTLQIFAADTVDEARPFADELQRTLTAALNGNDRDGNGIIDPVWDEGGILAAYDYALLMAEYPFLIDMTDSMQGMITLAQPSNRQVGILHFSDHLPQEVAEDGEAESSEYGDYGSESSGSDTGSNDGYGDEYSDNYSSNNSSPATDETSKATNFTLLLDQIPSPPTDSHYELWLRDDNGALLNLGILEVESGYAQLTGGVEQNLLANYNHVLISVEADDDSDETISDFIAFQGGHSTLFIEGLRQVLFEHEEYGKSLVEGAYAQIQTALAHSGFLSDALDADLEEARRHAEHVVNILEGKAGAHFGDIDGDGMAQNPGDGVGVLVYLEQALAQTLLATEAMTPTIDSQFHTSRFIATAEQSLDLVERATEKALQVFAADTAEEARPFSVELRQLLETALYGEDLDENGVIDPMQNEGAIGALYEIGLAMGEIGLYEFEGNSQE